MTPAVSSWQPQDQSLHDLLILLRDAFRSDNRDQLMLQQRLASFNRIPEYNSYLAHILTRMPQQEAYTRAIAGLTLKNNIRSVFNDIPLPVLDHVKACCMETLHNPDPDISVRRTVASVITAIVTRAHPHNCNDIFNHLLEVLTNTTDNPIAIEMGLDTLAKICEDAPQEMGTHDMLDQMIPRVIHFVRHANDPKLRVLAMTATNQFIVTTPPAPALVRHMDEYLSALFALATTKNTNDDTRQQICHALVSMLESCPERLQSCISSVIEYMVYCTRDDNETIALEACDFWMEYCNLVRLRGQLLPHMDNVVAALLSRMVYSEADLLMMEDDDVDATTPANQQLIDPSTVPPPPPHMAQDDSNSATDSADENAIDHHDEDQDDGDLEDDEFYSEWTLRKCSAASLDMLSTTYGPPVVSALLPHLNGRLTSDDWKEREGGILALGAVAEGGMQHLAPHLPEMIPYLIQCLEDPKPLVRSITCWALGRFSVWFVEQAATPEGRRSFFEPLLFNLLRRILDRNKRVQEAACSALSTLEEEASMELVPYLEPILVNLTTAFHTYQHKNLLILYDALGTLAESVGAALKEPKCLFIMLPPLIEKWNRLSDHDAALFPLLECLSSVTTALGTDFAPYAEPVFTRCVKLVATTLQQVFLSDQNPDEYDPPDVDCIVVALGLLSGLVQGLGHLVEPLIANSNPPLLSLLAVCVHDPVSEVLQATNALIGDLAMACFDKLRAFLPPILPELINQISADAEFSAASINAVWAIGEIALRWDPADMQPFVEPILHKLLPLFIHPEIPEALRENISITLGRLGYGCPEMIAPYLAQFLDPWLHTSLALREDTEKDTAFQGLCKMVKMYPQILAAEQFFFLLRVIGGWQRPSQHLEQSFREILEGYKSMLPKEQWQQVWNNLPQEPQRSLSQRYNLML